MIRTLVMMGPSGAGKSTVGAATARKLGVPFFEGDDFHPPGNIARIRRGEGLSDEDRIPWLDAIGSAIGRCPSTACVLACSALNRRVRERLARVLPGPALFLLIDVPEAELRRRLRARRGHVAGPELLASQLASMDDAPDVTRLDGLRGVDALAREAAATFNAAGGLARKSREQ